MYTFDMEILKVALTILSVILTAFFSIRAMTKQGTQERVSEESKMNGLGIRMDIVIAEINSIKQETKDIYREIRDSSKQSNINEQKIKEIFFRLDNLDDRMGRLEENFFKTPKLEMKGE